DEEDYMSDYFIDKTTDVRPGLTSASVAKLNKNERNSKLMNSLNKERHKPLNVIQQEKREEGLQSAIPKSNIGFQLLEKMGYKQDRGIGKSENGIKEPVPLNIKLDRKGLGHADNKRKQKSSSHREQEDQLKRMKLESQWRNRMRERWNDKEINRDLRRSQSVCERLDKNSPTEKLEMITEYLRLTHHYCVWCGREYSGTDDLKANCPGNNASVH
ncbi:hypothetical protein HELRODRAFT_143175, partial [Helobdella robusta]|uniref:G patch domain-containing protein 11 n=1 Tax=Helobdella robusta TaxID=6412 RepID=T1EJ92_HELRO